MLFRQLNYWALIFPVCFSWYHICLQIPTLTSELSWYEFALFYTFAYPALILRNYWQFSSFDFEVSDLVLVSLWCCLLLVVESRGKREWISMDVELLINLFLTRYIVLPDFSSFVNLQLHDFHYSSKVSYWYQFRGVETHYKAFSQVFKRQSQEMFSDN